MPKIIIAEDSMLRMLFKVPQELERITPHEALVEVSDEWLARAQRIEEESERLQDELDEMWQKALEERRRK